MISTDALLHEYVTSPMWIAFGARDEVRHGPVVDAVERERDVLDDERHADGGDQRRQPRRVPQRPVGDSLDRGVEERERRP